MPVKKDFRIVDDFYLWEAYQGINNGRVITDFRIVDNYYLYLVILAMVVGAELWQPGTGLESIQAINTLFPNDSSGDYAVCSGSSSTASGNNSFVAGGDTCLASGDQSFATGFNTTASGPGNSFASGVTTVASGVGSASFGSSTIASASYSFAIGNQNAATGNSSFAGGLSSVASGLQSFNFSDGLAFGSDAAGDNSAILGGAGNNISAAGDNSAIVGGTLGSVTGVRGFIGGGNGNVSSGADSVSGGDGCTASGPSSNAQNRATVASGASSHAGGFRSIASGDRSFNHSGSGVGLSDAAGADSAILGGDNNTINVLAIQSAIIAGTTNTIAATGLNSVCLGGTSQTVTEPNTAQAQNLRVTSAVRITPGANKSANIVTLDGSGTLVVANTLVKTGAKIFLTYDTAAGVNTVLAAATGSIVNNTSFVITSSAGDTSTVNYLIINP